MVPGIVGCAGLEVAWFAFCAAVEEGFAGVSVEVDHAVEHEAEAVDHGGGHESEAEGGADAVVGVIDFEDCGGQEPCANKKSERE